MSESSERSWCDTCLDVRAQADQELAALAAEVERLKKINRLHFTIPGAPRSPNRRGRTTRQRMALQKAERERALAVAVYARNTMGWAKITGPARITFTVYRHRLLDPLSNLPASLKHYQDGVCDALLPLGDGPGTPYQWPAPTQLAVSRLSGECVRVMVERL